MNIAEILKYCQTGMKLYSSIHGEVEFICVNKYNDKYPIKCKDESKYEILFTSDGRVFRDYPNAECALFPSKTQRDWSKFRIPIKKGDIMMNIDGTAPIVTGELYENISPKYICGMNSFGNFQIGLNKEGWTPTFYIPASEKAKKELFNKIAKAGYTWNADTLELEKIELKYRPFKNKEECWEEMQKHQPFGWLKAPHGKFFIIGTRNDEVAFGINDNWHDYNYVFNNYTFADGTLFGIKE